MKNGIILYLIISFNYDSVCFYYLKYQLIQMKIYFSLTTSPQRINKLHQTFDSIFKQSYPFEKIILNIPHIFNRNKTEYIIPNYLSNNPRIIINRCHDIGPGTKLVPSLFITNEEDIIITIDDDRKYLPNMLETFMEYYNQNNIAKQIAKQNQVLCMSCIKINFVNNITNFIRIVDPKYSGKQFQILQGYGGVLYPRKVFDGDFLKYCELLLKDINFYLSDDLYISNYLAMKKIPIILAVNSKCHIKGKELALEHNSDNVALHLTSSALGNSGFSNLNQQRYHYCIKLLMKMKLFYL
jgi:hypothetical protein